MTDSITDIRAVPFRAVNFLKRDIDVERYDDGTLVLRNNVPLEVLAPHLPWFLRRNATTVPDRLWIAQRRGPDRAWAGLTYGEALARVDAATQFLLDRGLTGRPIVVLSENSPEHAVLMFAAMQASMPYVPITTAYSLRATDFTRLRSMVDTIEPAAIFVQDAARYARALQAVVRPGVMVVAVDDPGPDHVPWRDLLATAPTAQVTEAVDRLRADTVAKYLFTSGSTGTPKAVTVTQGMLATGASMVASLIDRSSFTDDAVILDWLPWSHVAGGTAIFNRVLEEMGTLYIDDGRATPDAFAETIHNLREISPTLFTSTPLGYTLLSEAMDKDPVLAASFFRKLRFAQYAGARLPDDAYERFQAHAIAQTGTRIPFVCGYGSTETSPSCAFVFWPAERPGLIGLPEPGVELKLVPLDDDRYDVRVRSAAVTPGYLGRPDLTAAAFDEEGFYRTGDAATFADPDDVHEGLVFAGRTAEEFKLLSGTFVRVGSLRVDVLDAAAPLLHDVVVAGPDRPYLGLLAWTNPAAVLERFGADASSAVLHEALREALAAYNATHAGSSQRIRRVLLLREPPSQATGEINDKGYVNQRRVLELRHDALQALYAEPAPSEVIEL